jgi:uncharacterized protein (TIGR02246 family)
MLSRTWLRTFGCVPILVAALAASAGAQAPATAPPAAARRAATVATGDDPAVAEVRASGEAVVKAFNAGRTAELAGKFMPKGDLVDEAGTVTQGTKELNELFTKFFATYPGAKLALDIESVRPVGSNLVIEEGTRFVTAGDDSRAQLRYTAVRVKAQDGKWLIASIREFNDDPAPTPHEQLQPLAWLVGDWVSEGSDAVVKISYHWSEDTNFILGDFNMTIAGKPAMKSTQRIGWDPQAGKVRSWLFDGDGGFSEGQWTQVEDGWVIKSAATNPDGSTASATITISPADKDHFTMKGTDRIVANARDIDFDLTIARQPPAAGK